MSPEIYKNFNDLPKITFEGLFFTRRLDNYFLRSRQELIIRKVNTVLKGKNSLRSFGAIIWNSIPNDIKNTKSYNEFRSKTKI